MALADIFAGKGSLAEKLKKKREALEQGVDRVKIKPRKDKGKDKKKEKGYK